MRVAIWMTGLCVSLLYSLVALAEAAPAQRWVSAGGALSEWVVALGAEDRLVGVDSTSQHPASLQRLPSIGYQRQLSAEGVLALRPDLLIGSEEMGPPPVLRQLRGAGVRIEQLSAAADLQALRHNLARLGQLLGAPQRAGALMDRFERRLEHQQRWVAKAQRDQGAPAVLMLLGLGGGDLLVAGKDTVGDWLLRRAGGTNLASHSGYRALSGEALAALDPQLLVIADRSLRGAAAQRRLLADTPALAVTRAVREGRLLAIDPTLLVGGLGPRLPDELAILAGAFYPAARTQNAEAAQ